MTIGLSRIITEDQFCCAARCFSIPETNFTIQTSTSKNIRTLRMESNHPWSAVMSKQYIQAFPSLPINYFDSMVTMCRCKYSPICTKCSCNSCLRRRRERAIFGNPPMQELCFSPRKEIMLSIGAPKFRFNRTSIKSWRFGPKIFCLVFCSR